MYINTLYKRIIRHRYFPEHNKKNYDSRIKGITNRKFESYRNIVI